MELELEQRDGDQPHQEDNLIIQAITGQFLLSRGFTLLCTSSGFSKHILFSRFSKKPIKYAKHNSPPSYNYSN